METVKLFVGLSGSDILGVSHATCFCLLLKEVKG